MCFHGGSGMATLAYLYAPHISADIEQAIEPALRGRPLVMEEKGRVADCSWEAAALGVEAGVPLRQARLACPDLEVRTLRPDRARRHIESVWEALASAGAAVEPDTSGGAFVEPPRGLALPQGLAAPVRVGLPATSVIGTGPTRLVAKAAALEEAERLHRMLPRIQPDRLRSTGVFVRHVEPDAARTFLEGLPMRHFWICPHAIQLQLTLLGFRTVGEVARLGPEALTERFGPIGWDLWQKSRGVDPSPVLPAYPPPSVARGLDLDGSGFSLTEQGAALAEQVRRWALELGAELESRMQLALTLGIRLTLTAPRRQPALRDAPRGAWSAAGGWVTLSEAIRLSEQRRQARAFTDLAVRLLQRLVRQARFWLQAGASPLRLDLVAAPLQPARPRQASLMGPGEPPRPARMSQAIQAVCRQVGPGAIRAASGESLTRREAMLTLVEQGVGLP